MAGTSDRGPQRLPPLRAYMDDVISFLQTAACTSRLLKRIDELTSWARMKIKPPKSWSLSLTRGVRNDSTIFALGGGKIPLLSELPIKSLWRQYKAELMDKQMGRTMMKQLSEGKDRSKPTPREVQGLVLTFYTLQAGDVAAENE